MCQRGLFLGNMQKTGAHNESLICLQSDQSENMCVFSWERRLVDHLQDPLISIVSNPLHHIDPEGIHQLIMGFSQNLTCCLCQAKN